ncbi:hypothetical protein [Rhizobium halophytocola]|uniref:Uncharacterized protein n=1 Tax=Rhizobium halophytocola TaxID=735519 RepID=A0ABS4DXS1_9HYPH|nr:hypothetical protein [Rhizobium halophytocola]MBP1850487.1 hypothetical protein [Rhizobium halophytocola]
MRMLMALTTVALLTAVSAQAQADHVYCALDGDVFRLSLESGVKHTAPYELDGFRGVVSLKDVPVEGMHKNFRLTQEMLETSMLDRDMLELLLVSQSKTDHPFVTLTLKVSATAADKAGHYQMTVTSAPTRSSMDRKTVLSDDGPINCRLP